MIATNRTEFPVVSLENRDIEIAADTINAPGARASEFEFTLDGEIVAGFKREAVLGRRIVESR